MPRLIFARPACVQFANPPGTQLFVRKLGKSGRIGGRLDRRRCDRACRLVLAMSVPRAALPTGDDYERPESPDRAHHVAQQLFAIPLGQRLVQPLREPVVGDLGEVLLVEAVVLPGPREFVRPDQAEGVEQLGADRVVACLTTVDSEQPGSGATPTAQHRQHAALLVIGMRGGVEEAGRGLQLEDLLPRARRALIEHQRRQRGVRGVKGRDRNQGKQRGKTTHRALILRQARECPN